MERTEGWQSAAVMRARRRRGALPRVSAACAFLAAALLAAGCASNPLAGQRVVAYTPDVPTADRMPWLAAEEAAEPDELPPPAQPDTQAQAEVATNGVAASGRMTSPSRLLRKDDRVNIALRGIPRPEELAEVIDGNGNVNLPHIGLTRIVGLTTAEAEQVIEEAYVQGQIYRSVNVIILAQEDAFYIRGEVNRPGKYALSGDTTLMMGVSAAGGFTDYAKRSRIKVNRGGKVIWLNADRIEAGKVEDFLIHPDDLIVVERRIMF